MLAYSQIDPWGPERDNWHAASIATACLQPWSKKRLKIQDQLLKFGRREKPKQLSGKLREVAMRLRAKFMAKQ